MTRRTIQAPSSEIRAAFEHWLATACRFGARAVVLEGLTNSGKSFLTERPFRVGAGQSANIEVDQFLRKPVPPMVHYPDAIDQAALHTAIQAALASMPVVVIEGPMAWPLVKPMAEVGRDRVRRVYLKRMMRLKPDFWIDEDYLNDPNYWPPTDYHRSIYQYHAERRPWLAADLVLERIED
jgi:chloramphenicol 3-O-phosphotransferase